MNRQELNDIITTLNQLPKNFTSRTINLMEYLIAEDVSYKKSVRGNNWRLFIDVDEGTVIVRWVDDSLLVISYPNLPYPNLSEKLKCTI